MSELFSNVKITKFQNPKTAIKGAGRVTLANTVEISFMVLEGKNGIWAKLPVSKSNKKDENGYNIEYPDVKFLDKTTYQQFQDLVKANWSGSSEVASPSTEQVDSVPF